MLPIFVFLFPSFLVSILFLYSFPPLYSTVESNIYSYPLHRSRTCQQARHVTPTPHTPAHLGPVTISYTTSPSCVYSSHSYLSLQVQRIQSCHILTTPAHRLPGMTLPISTPATLTSTTGICVTHFFASHR